MKLKIFIPILMILIAPLNISAQESSIVINDYVPDFKLINPNTDTLKIDFNNDSVNDVVFYLIWSSAGNYLYIEPINIKCFTTTVSYYNTDSLSSNVIKWRSDKKVLHGEFNKTEKIGIKIISNDQNFFGWIKAYRENTGNTIWYIDKYAFCTIPDYPLLWGQTELTGAKEIKYQDKVKVSVDGQSKSINIQSKEMVKDISLINSAGRVIQKWRNLKSSMVDIPSEGIKGGIYLIRVKKMNNEVYTEKVVL
jgi:hypothetical protein